MSIIIELRCDRVGCKRVYPDESIGVRDYARLRARAMMAGWHWDPDSDKDYCPNCWWAMEISGDES